MSATNYVVRDMVHHIHDEHDYRAGKSVSGTFRKFKENFWVFILIICFSCGAGYVAVYLPDTLQAQKEKLEAAEGSLAGYQEKLSTLSNEQKAALMQQLGGGASIK